MQHIPFCRGVQFLVCLFVASCSANDIRPKIRVTLEGPAVPWTSLDVLNDPENFQFLIVSDRTGGERKGVFEDAIRKVNLLQPEFVVSVGDLIEGYTEDVAQLVSEWDEFDGFVQGLDMPFFYLPGNHDYTNAVMAELWKQRYGPSYYHFIYRDVLFLCMNTEDPLDAHKSGAIYDEQFEYFQRVLEEHTDVRWTLVFLHKPIWYYDESGRWPELEAILSNRPHTAFAGHHHSYVKFERHDHTYIMLATTGGGSKLRGVHYGQFDHVVWVTMTDDGPVLANLMLEGIWDEDIRTEAHRDRVGGLIQALHIEFEDATPDGAKLRIRNDADLSWDFECRLVDHPALSSGDGVHAKLPPNSIETFQMAYGVDCGRVEEKKPVFVTATFTTALEGQPDLIVERRVGLPICLPAKEASPK